MKQKCNHCDFVGKFDWFWLVTDEEGNCYSTFELGSFNKTDTLIEIYFCPECGAED